MMETERARLTLLTTEDFPDMIDMLMDPDTTRYISHLHRKEPEVYTTILTSRLDQIREGRGFHWVGRIKETNELVGALNLSLIPGTEKMQLGFQLKKKFWNKGFATELAQKALEDGSRQMKLATIYGVFERENLASRKVLEKLGFKPAAGADQAEENIITYVFTPFNSQL